ncbi:MAG: dihydrofolate reductase family protein, partial [Ilumatobacteraceae bacterium]
MSDAPAQRRLILYMSMSLDGFAARRDGTMDWLQAPHPNEDHRQRAVDELLGQTCTLVLGRREGQDMAKGWSSSNSPTGQF